MDSSKTEDIEDSEEDIEDSEKDIEDSDVSSEAFVPSDDSGDDEIEQKEPAKLKVVKSLQRQKKPILQWNRSHYCCPLCPETFSCYDKYFQHVQDLHDKVVSEVQPGKGSQFFKHQCLLCKRSIKLEDSAMKAHLKKKHDIELHDYERKFDSKLKAMFRTYDKGKCGPGYSPVRTQWNQSSLFCPLCDQKFTHYFPYRIHLRNAHNKKSDQVTVSEKNVRFKHTCLICNVKLLFELKYIKNHLMTHGITMKQYESQFKSELQEIFSAIEEKCSWVDLKFEWNQGEYFCPFCPSKFSSYQCYANHLHKPHNKLASEVPASKKNSQAKHTCLLCGNSVIFEMRSIKSHLLKGHDMEVQQYESQFEPVLQELFDAIKNTGAPEVGPLSDLKFQWNQNKYFCPFCSQQYSSYGSYNWHLKFEHNKQAHQVPPSEKNFRPKHVCLICNRKISFELCKMGKHLKYHATDIERYESRFESKLKVLFRSIEKNRDAPASWKESQIQWDQCKYFCPLCPDVSMSYAAYCNHLRCKHKKTVISEFAPSTKNVKRYHTCLICNKKGAFELKSVKKHLKTHKLTLENYQTRFDSELRKIFGALHKKNALESDDSATV